MIVRRVATWISTAMVAIVVATTLPVSQLRTVSFIHSCCCPDPDDCHCPQEKPERSTQPSMRTCHSSQTPLVAPTTPAFPPPATAVAMAPEIAVAAVAYTLPAPHQDPPPTRPDAPS